MLRIFTPVKIQWLRPGLNLRTWVPEASMLTTRPSKPSSSSMLVLVCLCGNVRSHALLMFSGGDN